MRTEIEIINVDEENEKAFIIGIEDDLFLVENETKKNIQYWDLEDLKQCVKFK